MTNKYRILDMAKDLHINARVIMDLLEGYGITPKNNMYSLSDDELNYLFDRLTSEHQVPDLGAIFRAQIEATRAAAEKAAAEKRAAEEKAAAEKRAAEEKAAAEKRAAEEKAAAEKRAAEEKAAAEKRAAEEKAAAEKRAAEEKAAAEKRAAEEKAAAERAAAEKAAAEKRAAEKKAMEEKLSQHSGTARGEGRRQRFQQPVQTPAKPAKQDKQDRTRAKDAQKPAVIQPRAKDESNEPVVVTTAETQGKGHHVDTRGASVNMARYDERGENLTPDTMRNADASKQKLTKKSTNEKKQGFNGGAKKRQEEADRLKKLRQEMLKKQVLKVMIPDEISVGELATRLKKTAAEVIKQLMKLGVMASVSQFIDFDTASLVAEELGAKVEHEVIVTIEDRLIDDSADAEENLIPRDPVVVVMGHVDHGKTSLLDSIRRTNVASGEAGGITQHIGAYRVHINDRDITFLDTPGHEAFTSMRARGASVTDVVILVVAADDGIMPQTIEAINHAKAAGAPIVVAVNKIDKPNAQPDRVLQQMTEYGLVPEAWGGDTITCNISATKGIGITDLLEMVILTADMQELRANPDRAAKGTVIEARLDKGRGPVATVLIQNGTLHTGDVIIAGTSVGHVRVMTDDKGRRINTAGPSIPAEIIGLSEVPSAGDLFYAVDDERMARELVEQRKQEEKDKQAGAIQRVSLDNLFDTIREGEMKTLNIIVKADVNGTSEAVKSSLEKLSNDEVRVSVIHTGVGAINESDVMLAAASNAIIVGFNVRPIQAARDAAEAAKVDMRLYRVIYDCLEEMEAAMKGMLAPKFRENVLGHAQVRETFRISSVGTIAGCYVTTGVIRRSAKVRIVRDGIVIHEGEIESLKRFKDDAREVATGYECGIGIERFNDIKVGDDIEAYIMEEIQQ